MNLLVIFDAIDGPLVYRPERKEEKENDNNSETGK
jgi:hypothetical protein